MQIQCWEKGLVAARMQRELSYGCSSSSGSGKGMGSSTRCSNAEDVERGGLASAQGPVPYNQSDAQCGVLLEHSPC